MTSVISNRKNGIGAKSEDSANLVDIIGNLPTELVQEIFLYVSAIDLSNSLKVNRRWKYLLDNNYFWKNRCKVESFHEVAESIQTEVYKRFVNKFQHHWLGVYEYNTKLKLNWKYNRYVQISSEWYKESFYEIKYFDDDILTALTWKNKLRFFKYNSDSVTEICYKKRVSHDICIWRTENFLVCWENFAILRVWNINELFRETTKFYCFSAAKILVKNNLAALTYNNGNCGIFNIKSGKVDYTIVDKIKDIDIGNDLIAFGTEDGAIQLLDWKNKSLTTLYRCNEEVIKMIKINNEYMISFWKGANQLENVSVWNLQTHVKLHTFYGIRLGLYELIWLSPRTFLTRVDDNRLIEVWDFLDGRRRFLINHYDYSLMTKIHFNDHYIFIWKQDSSVVSLWCIKTGCFVSRLDTKVMHSLMTNTKLALLNSSYLHKICILDFEMGIM